MLFDPSNFPFVNIQEGVYEDICIKKVHLSHILYQNNNRWMLNPIDMNDSIGELYSSYDQAYGDVLLSGLGFGLLAKWIANKPEVKSVTVVEKFNGVIELFKQNNIVDDKINIINQDIRLFKTKTFYDCIFLDHYELEKNKFILEDSKTIFNSIKHDVSWLWPLERIYCNMCFLDKNKNIVSTKKWNKFVKIFFPNELKMQNLTEDKIKMYINIFFNEKMQFDTA